MAQKKASPAPEEEDRRYGTDRRDTSDRRQENNPVAEDRRQTPRRKTQRRRQIDPTTCERDYSNDEVEFMSALDDYKRRSGRMFPTCSEVLEVIRDLGYAKPADAAAAVANESDDTDEESTWHDAPQRKAAEVLA